MRRSRCGGCETTAEKSAKLEAAAKQQHREEAARREQAARLLAVTTLSRRVTVTSTAVVQSTEGDAAILTLRNHSGTSLSDVPVSITVKSAAGSILYKNDVPGTATTLVSAALIPAHSQLTWIDDQVQGAGVPASVSARIGEGAVVTGSIPEVVLEGAHQTEETPGGASSEGDVVNRSGTTQQQVVVTAVARRAGRVVAAGRAVIPEAGAHASTHFQLYLIGSPRGAHTVFAVSPSTIE